MMDHEVYDFPKSNRPVVIRRKDLHVNVVRDVTPDYDTPRSSKDVQEKEDRSPPSTLLSPLEILAPKLILLNERLTDANEKSGSPDMDALSDRHYAIENNDRGTRDVYAKPSVKKSVSLKTDPPVLPPRKGAAAVEYGNLPSPG